MPRRRLKKSEVPLDRTGPLTHQIQNELHHLGAGVHRPTGVPACVREQDHAVDSKLVYPKHLILYHRQQP